MLFNVDAETHLLACLFLEQTLIKEVKLKPEHFYSSKNKIIFIAIKEAEKREMPTDVVTVFTMIPKEHKKEVPVSYLSDLSKSVPTIENYEVYEKLILDSFKLRMAKIIARKIDNDLEVGVIADDAQEVITTMIQKLTKLEEVGYIDDFDLKTSLSKITLEMDKDTKGIDTGYKALNSLTNGWQDGDLIIIGARPSIGKTAFALNLASNAAKDDAIVTLFSLEMAEDILLKRMICAEGRIEGKRMRNPNTLFEERDWERFAGAISVIEPMKLFIYDSSNISVQEIRAKVRSLKRRYPENKHLVIIDYLQLIRGNGGKENRNIEISEISRSLKILARELSIPVITLSQLSRSVEHRQDKRPSMSDLRDSGSLEQDADIVMFMYRDDYYNMNSENKNTIEINIAKQRNGATGRIELTYLKEFNLFLDKFISSNRPALQVIN